MAISSRASQAGGRLPLAPPGLPVWNTVRTAFADVLANSDKVTRLALPWLILCWAVNLLGLGGPSLLEPVLGVSQVISGLGGLAINVAWIRWRMIGEAPPAGARPNRHAGRVVVRLLWPIALLGVGLAGALVLIVGLSIIAGSKAIITLGMPLAALAFSILYLALYPVLGLYGMAGAVGGPGTSLKEIRALTKGYRGRLWLAYELMLLVSFLIPVLGVAVGMGTFGSLWGALEDGDSSSLTDIIVTSLGQLISFGMAALFGAFTATAWTRLKVAKGGTAGPESIPPAP